MDCPQCGADGVRVKASRKDTDISKVRYRHCLACDYRFYSVEVQIPDAAIEHVRTRRGFRRRPGFRNVTFS